MPSFRRRRLSARPTRKNSLTLSRRPTLERLEDRLVLSSISWVNRGDPDNGFNDVYPDPVVRQQAKQVVDWAIDSWERVITEFNYPTMAGVNNFNLHVYMDPDESSCGGHGSSSIYDDGVPSAGDFTINTCNGGGWWLDPTPWESSEFRGAITNAFALDATAGGPAAGMADLYTVAVLEMAHVLGINTDEDSLFEDLNDNTPPFTDTGLDDAAYDVGTLWAFDGVLVDALFTDNNLGNGGDDGDEPVHTAEAVAGNAIVVNGTTFYGAEDSDNATYEGGRRYLPSRLVAMVMDEVYPYTIVPPENFGTAYANLDWTTGNLLLRGGSGTSPYSTLGGSDDSFTLSREGDKLRVDVGIGNPVLGTASNTILTSYFDWNLVQSITVQPGSTDATNDGDDFVYLNFSQGDVIPPQGISIDTGSGENSLFVFGPPAGSQFQLDGGELATDMGLVTFTGVDHLTVVGDSFGGGNDFVVFGTDLNLLDLMLVGGGAEDTFVVKNTSTNLENLKLMGLGAHDMFQIDGRWTGTTVEISGDDGEDLIQITPLSQDLDDVNGDPIAIDGGADDDILLLDDGQDIIDNSYILDVDGANQGEFFRNATLEVYHNGVESVLLYAGESDDLIDVRGTPTGADLTIGAGEGHDTLSLSSNGPGLDGTVNRIKSKVTIDGSWGADTLSLNDRFDATPDTLSITNKEIGAKPGDTFFGAGGSVAYKGLEGLDIKMGRGGNTVYVEGLASIMPTHIATGEGHDQVTVAAPPDPTGYVIRDQGTVDNLHSVLTVVGEKGTNHLKTVDTTDSTGDKLTITGTEVGLGSGDTYFGPGGGLVYSEFSSLKVFTGKGGDGINVQSIGTPTEIVAGKGTDTLSVDSNGSLPGGTVDEIVRTLTIAGNDGNDTLTLEDSSDASADLVTIDATTVGAAGDTFFGGGGGLVYGTLETLIVNAGTAGDTIDVRGTNSGTATAVFGGGGGDLIRVDSNGTAAGGTANEVRSRLTIDGGEGPDTLRLNDESDALGNTFSVGPSQVNWTAGDNFFGAGGKLTYNAIGELLIFAGQAADTINVLGTSAQTPVTIAGNGGGDLIRVDSNGAGLGGNVDGVKCALTLDGGIGADMLDLNDVGDTTGDIVSISPTEIGAAPGDTFFAVGGRLKYKSFSTAGLKTSGGHDTVRVLGTPGGSMTIDVGGGNDQVYIDSNGAVPGGKVQDLLGALNLFGGAGGNSLSIDDSSDPTARQVTVAPIGANVGTIGQGVGDNFFGAGGFVSYNGLSAVSLNMGKAADKVLLTPSPSSAGTRFIVNGDLPKVLPGDRLELNLAGVINPQVVDFLFGSGEFNSDSHAHVEWTGIEDLIF